MSALAHSKAISVSDIQARKNQTPLVCLTAYTTPMARLLDQHCDLLLVGDSLGMVLYGMETTLNVSVDMMIAHACAVKRGAATSCIIVDLPFGSYQASPDQAFHTAVRIMQETGCAGVKLEGGSEMAPTVKFLTSRGIPVLGHIGLMPQSVNTAGGYRAHGKDKDEADKICDDAIAIADAGAFACVIEGTVEAVARRITDTISIPTIGIGASVACDGQILVTEDVLGLFADFTPKFVKKYADLGPQVSAAIEGYSKDVKSRSFPGPEHCFGIKKLAPDQ